MALEHYLVHHSYRVWLANWLFVCYLLYNPKPMRCVLLWLQRADQPVGKRRQVAAYLCSEYGFWEVYVLKLNTLMSLREVSYRFTFNN